MTEKESAKNRKMWQDELRPKKRSALRIALGKRYFVWRRHLLWHFGGLKFAKTQCAVKLPIQAFTHHTPLLRQLRNVDMALQYQKIVNLKIAVRQINGILIKPQETFSYWKLIGKPTHQKGYLEGLVLHGGSFGPGVGGGLCQLSNLIYWMALHTPLTVTERYRHSYDVFPDANRKQPFGSGATCVYNYRDLMLRNDTSQTFQLNLWLTESDLYGEFCCELLSRYRYEVYEKQHEIQHAWWGGYIRHNTLYRRLLDENDAIMADKYLAENHALMMYAPFLSGNEDKSSDEIRQDKNNQDEQ